VTLENGRILKVASAAAAGQRVGVLMRPERFSTTGANTFSGRVIEAVYLGTAFKLRLDCGGMELLVRQPARGRLPETNAQVDVAIELDAIHVF
jgi:putative spermidine/putrescine transport system ATP-binding protein